MTLLGNAKLLESPKTAFLASRKIPHEAVMASLDWAARVREMYAAVGEFQEIGDLPTEIAGPMPLSELRVYEPRPRLGVRCSLAVTRKGFRVYGREHRVYGFCDVVVQHRF